MRHLLSIEALGADELKDILKLGVELKATRGRHSQQPLAGKTWAMMFSKASTRTRVSFEVGVRELGGNVIFLSQADSQLGRGEPIKDTARVMGRMVHGAIIRTFAQEDVEEFAEYSGIPTVNALTDAEHPCQILGDLLTIQEHRGSFEGVVVSFIGDGDCNVARSWIYAAEKLDFQLKIVAPKAFQPGPDVLSKLTSGHVVVTDSMDEGVLTSDVLYTDVWVSMGKEAEAAERLDILKPYQISREAVEKAAPDALVMHCLPAYRGKEVTEEVFEQHAKIIFDQAENRLHIQKAILSWLTAG
jgi:ornithine carbamoyltransferase